jgi:hypothetical protein
MDMFYEKYLAKIISDMTQVVVAVGLVTVLTNYTSLVMKEPAYVYSYSFWLHIALLILTIMFTTYNLLAYTADFASQKGDTSWCGHSRSPTRIIALFLIDLAAVGILAAMYGVFVLEAGSAEGHLTIEWSRLSWIAACAATWHGAMLLWHVVAGSRVTAPFAHLIFSLAFGSLAALAVHHEILDITKTSNLAQIVTWMVLFLFVVALLYFTRGRQIIYHAISDHEGASSKA